MDFKTKKFEIDELNKCLENEDIDKAAIAILEVWREFKKIFRFKK